MHRTTPLLHAIAISSSMIIIACGGAPDLEGVYQVTSHTLNNGACDSEGPAANDYAYFSLRNDDFLGEDISAFGTCTGPDMASCQDFGLLSAFFDDGGMWRQQTSTAFFSADCVLGYNVAEILDLEGGSLRIEFHSYSESDGALAEDGCTTDEADARSTSMPCVRYEVVEGTPVP